MKDERLFVRMSTQLRDCVRRAAFRRGEAESVIVREALNQYFEARDMGKAVAASAVYPASRGGIESFNERAPRKPRKP